MAHWSLAFLAALFCGYYLDAGGIGSGMWIKDLFSEYEPPRPIHTHLLESRLKAKAQYTDPETLWNRPASNRWKRCDDGLKPEKRPVKAEQTRYFQVLCGGGLFQLHICVCNAVTVARLLNATLVIPYFKYHPFWKDPSQFEDIYDAEHFISYLQGEVEVIKSLPAGFSWSTPEYYWNRCLERPNCKTFLPKHATLEWFLSNLLPLFESYSIATIDGFEHKLTFEGLPEDMTKLRCRTNFYGLRFLQPIRDLGQILTTRMRAKDDYANTTSGPGGRYIGLHMRFERDMIAHSNCDYGGGRAQMKALASFRYHMWNNRVRNGQYRPEVLRRNGSCPLTPEELGLTLAAFGFKESTPVFIAGREPYGGEARVKPLKNIFPRIETKFTLATEAELNPLRKFSHRLTALDFVVLFNSDLFLSNAAGNFANVLSGHRSFFGPRKSIHPDKASLTMLFSDRSLEWDEFAERVVTVHQTRLGALVSRKRKFSVFRYPAPDCMCRDNQEVPTELP